MKKLLLIGMAIGLSSCCAVCPPKDITFPILIRNAVPMPGMNMIVPLTIKKGDLTEFLKTKPEKEKPTDDKLQKNVITEK